MDIFGIKRRRNEKNFDREVSRTVNTVLLQYAEATAVHVKAFAELNKVAQSKINSDPNYGANNYHQQSGFSFEIKEVSRRNAENTISGSEIRFSRTDNVGHVNDPTFDIVEVDSKTGEPLHAAGEALLKGAQLKKFISIETYRCLCGADFEKYKSAELVIPKDQFDNVIADWDAQLNSLEKQHSRLELDGMHDLAIKKQHEIDKIKDAKTRLRRSSVSTAEAMEARKAPGRSTVKEVTKISHRAGLQAAKQAAVFGLGVSVIRNVFMVSQSKKTHGEASLDVAVDTGKAAATAYLSSAASSALGGALQTTSNQMLQNLGRGNGPVVIFQTGTMLAKLSTSLAQGKITAEQFVQGVGREGSILAVSISGSGLGAIMGSMVLPGVGTVVGGFVGGMTASLMSGALYAELQRSVQELQASDARRKQIELMCEHLIAQHEEYRREMDAVFDQFFEEKRQELKSGFDAIIQAIRNGESIHDGLAAVACTMGKQLAFSNTDEFQHHLGSGKVLKI